jgi:hypothetical protein
MVTKTSISSLFAIVFLITAGCSPTWNLGGGGSEKFTSADVTGQGQAGLLNSNVTAGGTDALPAPEVSNTTPQVTREIEEADMVKLIDHTLYVLNRYRGLRVIDVADWSNPVLKGSFTFIGTPVEMYVVNQVATIIVLTDGLCRLDEQAQVVKQSGTTVYLVDVSNVDAPRAINLFGIDGVVSESRRVGDVVYLAGRAPVQGSLLDAPQGYSQQPDGFVASVLVADPLKVQLVDQKTFTGQGEYIHATQNAVFVSGVNWETGMSKIQYVDISDPAGKIVLRGSCEVPGQILDRFAMDANENVLRVVADKPRWFGSWAGQPVKEAEPEYGVKLFTFDLTNPDDIKTLGSLFIIKDETVRAVRFDGLKGYVVTFEQRDPLWVVDLADAANPKISGYLAAPGYSTYLQSDGNRLVAVGLDDSASWRASVMLYDVSDPANPKELDRAVLGEEYSSSEANYDDKAFKVIPEADLILVPFDFWKDGYQNKLAMIDYSGDKLTNLAQIDHRGTAVRSGVDLTANVLWVLSQNALQTLDISNRQSPQQLAMVTLAENVLAFKPAGQYGLRLVSLSENWSDPAYELQAVNGNDPNGTQVLSRLSLSVRWPQLIEVDNSLAMISGQTQEGKVKLSAVNIAGLPNLTLMGENEFDFYSSGGGYYPLARTDGFISPVMNSFAPIWQGGSQDGPYLLDNKALVYVTWNSTQGNNQSQILKVVSLADPADMKVAGEIQLNLANNETRMQFGSSGTTVFLSTAKFSPLDILSALGGNNNQPMAHFYIQLIDCSDPANPQAGAAINVPGVVAGFKDQTVYTIDPQWQDNGIATSFCAVRLGSGNADLMGKVDLPAGQPGRVFLAGNTVVLTVGESFYAWGGAVPMVAPTATATAKEADACGMGSFRIVSIRIADPYNLAAVTDTEYPGTGQIAGVSNGFVVAQLSYPNQALVWQIADDQSLVFKKVTDLPGYISDLSVSNGLINLVCGYGGVLQIDPNN